MNKQTFEEMRALKNVMERFFSFYKLTHLDDIKEAKKKVLKSKARKKVYDLCDGKRGVTEIADVLKLSQPTATHHLTELYELGLLSYEVKKGKKYFYKVI